MYKKMFKVNVLSFILFGSMMSLLDKIHQLGYKKPSSRRSAKNFKIFGHILVLKVSYKFLNLAI